MRDGKSKVVAPRVDPKLRAHFKEIARDIVSKDRWARKHGVSQNTIGSITSAITQAYMMGQDGIGYADIANADDQAKIVDWVTIPPRARNTLLSMTCGLSNFLTKASGTVEEIEKLYTASKPKWRVMWRGASRDDGKLIADGSVAPLIRMKLLEPTNSEETIYKLTQLGLDTCKDYWRRSDVQDPTLPKISLR